jgi:hypothetical protein
MASILSLIWDKCPTLVKWIIGAIVLFMWAPMAIRDGLQNFVHEEAEASMSSFKIEQKYKDQAIIKEMKTIKDDMKIVKHYILYKKVLKEPEPIEE